MARSYGRVTTSIWQDEDFRALEPKTQAMYFLLVTQAEITAAGTLPLTLRRWAKMAHGVTVDMVHVELALLVERRFVIVDEDTEELLVRSFVKWDGGHANSKRRPVIHEAALTVASPILRSSLAVECSKLGLTDTASALDGNTTSAAVSASDRVVVTEVGYVSNPQPSIHEREPLGDAEPSSTCSKHPNGTDEPCGPCGTARRQHDGWVETSKRSAGMAKAAVAAARAACPDCDENGFQIDSDGKPVARCTHRRTA